MTTPHFEGETGWLLWSDGVDADLVALLAAINARVLAGDVVLKTGATTKDGVLTLTDGLTIPSGGTLTLPNGAVEIIEVNGLTTRLSDIDAAIVAAATTGGTGSKIWVRDLGDATIPVGAVNGDVIFTKTV